MRVSVGLAQGAKTGVKPASRGSRSPTALVRWPRFLAVTGLTHHRSCEGIPAIAAIKMLAVSLVIAIFYGAGAV